VCKGICKSGIQFNASFYFSMGKIEVGRDKIAPEEAQGYDAGTRLF